VCGKRKGKSGSTLPLKTPHSLRARVYVVEQRGLPRGFVARTGVAVQGGAQELREAQRGGLCVRERSSAAFSTPPQRRRSTSACSAFPPMRRISIQASYLPLGVESRFQIGRQQAVARGQHRARALHIARRQRAPAALLHDEEDVVHHARQGRAGRPVVDVDRGAHVLLGIEFLLKRGGWRRRLLHAALPIVPHTPLQHTKLM